MTTVLPTATSIASSVQSVRLALATAIADRSPFGVAVDGSEVRLLRRG
jgi:hypothetical protein